MVADVLQLRIPNACLESELYTPGLQRSRVRVSRNGFFEEAYRFLAFTRDSGPCNA